MDLDETLRIIKQRQQENSVELSYNYIYHKLQQVTDAVKITELIKILLKKFTQNRDRDKFFYLNFPVIIFKFALLKYSEFSIFYHCSVLLNKILSETPEKTANLEDYIIRCLHKPYYNESLQFYVLVGNMCTSSTSAEAMLHSAIPSLLVKFYHSKISSKSRNTYIFESLDYETLKATEDSDNSDSDKSGATMASSLSLDEDIAYKRNEDNKPLSARSILSDFANTLLDDDDQYIAYGDDISDRQDDFENQSAQYTGKGDYNDVYSASNSRRGADFDNEADFMRNSADPGIEPLQDAKNADFAAETQKPDENPTDGRPVSYLQNLPKKPVVYFAKSAFYSVIPSRDQSYIQNADKADISLYFSVKEHVTPPFAENEPKPKKPFYLAPNQTSDMLQINYNYFDYIRYKEVLAIAGPLCPPMKSPQKPKFVPNLDIKVLRNMDYQTLREDIAQNRYRFAPANAVRYSAAFNPMAWGKRNEQIIDQTYIKQLQFISEQRKGNLLVQEIGTLLGYFMAMSEYPVITTLIKSDAVEQVEQPTLVNRADMYRDRYFGNRNAREVFDYSFNFTYFQKIMQMQDELTVRDIYRLGVIFVLHVLTRYSPQLTVQALPSTHVFFTHDMLDMRAEKSGFLPASLLALHTLVTEITQARLTLQLDQWQNALSQMQTHVFSYFYYINVFEEEETTKDDKHAYVYRTITLPSLVYLLERLEGTRRRLFPEMRMLATKLDDLVRLYRNLSAVEDMPHVIGVIVDRLESSQGSKVMRACAVEMLLPSLMKLIELIITKKIKNRQFYVFISHKVIQLLAVLMKTTGYSRDFYQANIDQIFLKMLVFDASDIVPWLRRYGYLMLVTSRVYFELSGLFIDARQCEQTFEQIRIAFAYFCGNLARLIKNFYFYRFNSAEDTKMLDLKNLFVPPEANLREMNLPNGDDSSYDLDYQVQIHYLPVHSVCEFLADQSCLYNQKSSNYFVKQHNCVKNKEVYNGMQIDFSEYLFLIDYDSGVLTQYSMLSQAAVFKHEKDRLVYHNCLLAIRDLISIPDFVNVIKQYQINKHIIYHYTSFLKFYNLALSQLHENFNVTAFYLADAHLQVLIEFVNTGDVAIRYYFLIIKIIDFLTQYIMYESLSDYEKAMNRLYKTSLLPTYRANDSEETLSELDFALDDEQPPSQPKILPPAAAGLYLHFDELEYQAKESKNSDCGYYQQNIGQLFDEPDDSPAMPAIPANMSVEQFASKAENAFDLITERESPDAEPSKRYNQTPGPFYLTLKLPNPAVLHKPYQEFYDIDSDMDGWENTAARLNIDMGAVEYVYPTPQYAIYHVPPADLSDSDDIPLCKPIQKMSFGLYLNLGNVQEKRADLKPQKETPEHFQTPDKVDLNLKMHLVLANYSARKQTDISEQEYKQADKKPLGNDQYSINYQDDGIYLLERHYNMPEAEEDLEVPYNPIYYDDYLHFSVIKLILVLIINPKTGGLDANYVTQFPTNNGLMNIPVILHNHLNSKRNVKIVEMLIKAQFNHNTRRLLRLLCYSYFDPEYYDLRSYRLLARGAYGEVYSGYVNVTYNDQYFKHSVPVAVKLYKLSGGLYDRCVLHDIFQEVTALEKVEEDTRFCQLFDYGVTPQGYIIVMRRYYTSFKNLREKLFDDEQPQLRYYNPARKMSYYGHEYSMMRYVRVFLLTYVSFLKHLQALHEQYKIIHFDLKCDNLFVNPASIKWLTQQSSPDDMRSFVRDILSKHIKARTEDQLPFSIALSDFGESHIFSSDNDENTLLSKGTEFNKSPEMLVATNQQFAKSFNRRRQKGAGIPSDIWSSACTLYEMLTNDYLFYDSDWIRFFLRVTSINSDIEYAKDSATFGGCSQFSTLIRGSRLPPEKRAMLGNCLPLIDLIEFQLVQDPAKRPGIYKIIHMTEYILETYFPLEYRFDTAKYEKNIKPEPFVAGEPFNCCAFYFSIDAAYDLCMANALEILAPKCSVIVKDENITGSRLSKVTLKYTQMGPADLLYNAQILLGSVHDAQDAKSMNATNVSTVIDCTCSSSKSESKITTISHVYRPDLRLFEIYTGNDQTAHNINFRELVIALEEVFDVVRCAMVKNSAVLLVDEAGNDFAACLAVACLMEFESLGIYPAVVYLKRIRPTVYLKLQFLGFLQAWHDNRVKIGIKLLTMFAHLQLNPGVSLSRPEYYQLTAQRVAQSNYRCVCGKVFFVQKMFTDTGYVLCNCVCSRRNHLTLRSGKPNACPSPSCRTLQNYYTSLYGLKMHKMLYTYGRDDDFISNWTRATIQAESAPDFRLAENQQIQFRTVDNMRSPLYRLGKKDGWTLFLCKICGSPTHFIRVEAGEDQRQICVICNISNK